MVTGRGGAHVGLGRIRHPAASTIRLGHWLLARRGIAGPSDLAYYICFGPADTSIEELVRVAGCRWAIEECFQAARNETGLDHYQVRGYQAWYRHITLSMAAAAFLVLIRDAAHKRGTGSGTVQLDRVKPERGTPPVQPHHRTDHPQHQPHLALVDLATT